MVTLHAIRLAVFFFGQFHLLVFPAFHTIHAISKHLLVGLIPVENVLDTYIPAKMPGQYFCDRHY